MSIAMVVSLLSTIISSSEVQVPGGQSRYEVDELRIVDGLMGMPVDVNKTGAIVLFFSHVHLIYWVIRFYLCGLRLIAVLIYPQLRRAP
jgi:hypothetical protein